MWLETDLLKTATRWKFAFAMSCSDSDRICWKNRYRGQQVGNSTEFVEAM